MSRQFARLGVPVAEPYYVLLTGPEGARSGWYMLAGLSGFVALLGLLPVIGVFVARARRRQSGLR
ncbi:hypothetical protein NDN01_06670 [Sphingomonas sp. QA11]|uniref:hypothetical protein n=1 Tax=Sphingomonas sp. QA11 TaxID=2950605 RepID=UPI00234A4B72|nr:hypothetical protein [Sphingomonas sp. QA11]WCM28601.1 hypothetical protein NDN01_06670 [Sphingomonas sp. QA11]